jgi:hypothetical protein
MEIDKLLAGRRQQLPNSFPIARRAGLFDCVARFFHLLAHADHHFLGRLLIFFAQLA